MSAQLIPAGSDPLGRDDRPLTVTVDGVPVRGVHGQTLATVLLADGHDHWRTAPTGGGRGVFCGIGVCFDCVATVNGIPDIRLCRRPARDGDTVHTQSRTSTAHTEHATALLGDPNSHGEQPAPIGSHIAHTQSRAFDTHTERSTALIDDAKSDSAQCTSVDGEIAAADGCDPERSADRETTGDVRSTDERHDRPQGGTR
ncbi:(2Fe-2S)-binding protein [Nocardia vulneris]|uniref:(2Fe-2S)-binding protein n=1 Tax=Nocardia vulneris TaxID=1141657 RepID=UPI0007C7FC43|nr:(2Fe-2S)-binding protein [Nocardia vulneris]